MMVYPDIISEFDLDNHHFIISIEFDDEVDDNVRKLWWCVQVRNDNGELVELEQVSKAMPTYLYRYDDETIKNELKKVINNVGLH